MPLASLSTPGHDGDAMEIIDLPPTPLVLPASGDLVRIRTQRWALERWNGEDPPTPAIPWGRKPNFSVNGRRSCAELAIVEYLRGDGWHGVWVNAFRNEFRSEWFPAPPLKTLAEADAPRWAIEIFDRLRAANDGRLSGFFDVFAWREPGQVRFCEAKVGPDWITPSQLRFVEVALRLHHLHDFTIIEVAGPSPGEQRRAPRSAAEAAEPNAGRSIAGQLCSNGQGLVGRPGKTCYACLTTSPGLMSPKPARSCATSSL